MPSTSTATTNGSSSNNRTASPETRELRRAMLSILPPTQTAPPRRPKLSLQTSLPPMSTSQIPISNTLQSETDSPTVRNTYHNAFEAPPPTPSSAFPARLDFPPSFSSSIASSRKRGHVSPFPNDGPYTLPMGAVSCLRNSPLPRRYLSATTRKQKRLFPPTKKVTFRDEPQEIIPTPVIEASEEELEELPRTLEEREERKAEIQAEDGHATKHGKRLKRQREWIWRPMPEDLSHQAEGKGDSTHSDDTRTLRYESL